MSKTVSFYTLGCKLNQYETDVIRDSFIEKGYKTVDFGERADVSLINTCLVTKRAEQKSCQAIRRAKKISPDGLIIVAGCYAQLLPDDIMEIPGVRMILGSQEKFRAVSYIDELSNDNDVLIRNSMQNGQCSFASDNGYATERTRAFLKIQDGCSSRCSYCIVPDARGESRCRDADDIIKKAGYLGQAGFNEIVLTGVNIANYHNGTYKNIGSLLKHLISIKDIPRIRLSSIEVNKIDDEFINLLASSDKLCKHLHIPLQSGDDTILTLMKRKYTTEFYRRVIDKLVSKIPNIGIGADVIVGFPGEKAKHFENTLNFIKSIPFSYLHVFRFSPRNGTVANNLPDKVNTKEIKDRSERIRRIAQEKKMEFFGRNIGRNDEVVFEKQEIKNVYSGFTSNYVRVWAEGKNLVNRLEKVNITGISDTYMKGELLSS